MITIVLLTFAISQVASKQQISLRQFEFTNLNDSLKQCYLKYSASNSLQFRCDYKSNSLSYLESRIEQGEEALSLIAMSWKEQKPIQINFSLFTWQQQREASIAYPYTEKYNYTRKGTVLIDFTATWYSQNVSSNILRYGGYYYYDRVYDIESLRYFGVDNIKYNGTEIVQFLFLKTKDYGTPVKGFEFLVLTFTIYKNYTVTLQRNTLSPPGGMDVKTFKFLRKQYIYIAVNYQEGYQIQKYFNRFTWQEEQNIWGLQSAHSYSFNVGEDQVYILSSFHNDDDSYSVVVEEFFNTGDKSYYQSYTLDYFGSPYHTLHFTGQYLQIQNDSTTGFSLSRLCSYRQYLDIDSLKCVACTGEDAISIAPYATRCYTYAELSDYEARKNSWYKFNALYPGQNKYAEPSTSIIFIPVQIVIYFSIFFIIML
ncbi:hypothetical protein FGO68_gene4071 [Halteria grandinella]|uniref:Transmembrane protein n=1 Tax=Halteria grandinella TaxID=5974 RepID=A0A8J8NPD0_HALGN|nr:hypothetical protein FGO68_gene4071 [Halteria grandinella]